MKKFTNTTNKEFTCSWNGVEQTFLPNESAILEDGIAKVFAKHLANLRFEGNLIESDAQFVEEMNKYLSDASSEIEVEEIAEQVFIEVEKEVNVEEEEAKVEEAVQEMVKEEPKKKGRKSKKETFEGLDDETTI